MSKNRKQGCQSNLGPCDRVIRTERVKQITSLQFPCTADKRLLEFRQSNRTCTPKGRRGKTLPDLSVNNGSKCQRKHLSLTFVQFCEFSHDKNHLFMFYVCNLIHDCENKMLAKNFMIYSIRFKANASSIPHPS
jgi:hypothetical protein